MGSRESYSRYIGVALVLTVVVLALFQVYIFREPTRIAADEQRDELIAVSEGRVLYTENCAMCHGELGEGVDGPPLNSKSFLRDTADETIFSVISSGVPSSEMPAWNQVHGGPLTDEQVRQLVSFIRAWEPDAPDREAEVRAGNPVNGLVLYNSTCVVCHGPNGEGTADVPALNDPEKLARFDDEWYIDTITEGRPSKGMPTWGTVMSPDQVYDLVALLRAWEQGETVQLPGPEESISEALHALGEGDIHGAEHGLEKAIEGATGDVLVLLNEAMAALEDGDAAAAETAMREALALLGVSGGEHDDAGGEHDEAPAAPEADSEHDDDGEHDEAPPPSDTGSEHDDGDDHDEN
ncbi:MAG TPA: c-type cytochrome [Anaerolineae bacterium]|nr:c-type cytochrome [Anaerolineae bacterium]